MDARESLSSLLDQTRSLIPSLSRPRSAPVRADPTFFPTEIYILMTTMKTVILVNSFACPHLDTHYLGMSILEGLRRVHPFLEKIKWPDPLYKTRPRSMSSSSEKEIASERTRQVTKMREATERT